MTNSILLLCNNLSEVEEEFQVCLFELQDKVHAILDSCVKETIVYHLPSPLLTTIDANSTIHDIFEDVAEGNDVVVVKERISLLKWRI